MEGFGMRQPHPDPIRLFFSVFKTISFKKLNGTCEDEKILKPTPFTFDNFDFCFYFLFFILYIYIYYIKINIFHKK